MSSARPWFAAGFVSLAAGYAAPVMSAPGEPQLSLAAPSFVVQFRSDETWPVDTSSTHVMPVCLNFTTPAPKTCPTTAPVLYYSRPGSEWGADLATIPGAKWVWDAAQIASNSSADNDEFSTSKSFEVPFCGLFGKVSGEIWLAADDFAEVLVDDTPVGQVGSTADSAKAFAAQSNLERVDLSGVHPGTNKITVRAKNGPGSFGGCQECSYPGNPAGVVFGGSISCRSAR